MNNENDRTIKIDVYADIACPWCFIGKRRLDQALAERPNARVERQWRPFQLRPEMPSEGVDWNEFVETKFGGHERAHGAFTRVAESGAPDGITFHFDRIKRAPNTEDAHRLVLFAAESGREWETSDALFSAYFEQGRDVGDLEVLVEVASEAGLDAEEVRAYLASDANRAAVQASQEAAHQIGVDGVPFYILNDRYGISGAQPVELLVAALDRIGELEHAA
jgi:predicted DsbA family dithiol-disulfide isomerase